MTLLLTYTRKESSQPTQVLSLVFVSSFSATTANRDNSARVLVDDRRFATHSQPKTWVPKYESLPTVLDTHGRQRL
jgi:hypothetical protein